MMIAAGPDPRRHAPATLRNRGPILEVLRQVLPAAGTVLEIASGSGEHAVFFADALPDLMWQPTDPDPDNRASIRAWIAETGVTNVTAPADLNAAARAWPVTHADAIVCINMIHISPWAATLGLLAGARGRCRRRRRSISMAPICGTAAIPPPATRISTSRCGRRIPNGVSATWMR